MSLARDSTKSSPDLGGWSKGNGVGLSNPQLAQGRRTVLDLVNRLHSTGFVFVCPYFILTDFSCSPCNAVCKSIDLPKLLSWVHRSLRLLKLYPESLCLVQLGPVHGMQSLVLHQFPYLTSANFKLSLAMYCFPQVHHRRTGTTVRSSSEWSVWQRHLRSIWRTDLSSPKSDFEC